MHHCVSYNYQATTRGSSSFDRPRLIQAARDHDRSGLPDWQHAANGTIKQLCCQLAARGNQAPFGCGDRSIQPTSDAFASCAEENPPRNSSAANRERRRAGKPLRREMYLRSESGGPAHPVQSEGNTLDGAKTGFFNPCESSTSVTGPNNQGSDSDCGSALIDVRRRLSYRSRDERTSQFGITDIEITPILLRQLGDQSFVGTRGVSVAVKIWTPLTVGGMEAVRGVFCHWRLQRQPGSTIGLRHQLRPASIPGASSCGRRTAIGRQNQSKSDHGAQQNPFPIHHFALDTHEED